MTSPASSLRALWFALLATLLAVQSASGLRWEAPRGDGAQRVRVTAATPPTVHLRDAGKLVQVAARAVAANPYLDGGGDPPLPSRAAQVAAVGGAWATATALARHSTSHIRRTAAGIRARAPPLVG